MTDIPQNATDICEMCAGNYIAADACAHEWFCTECRDQQGDCGDCVAEARAEEREYVTEMREDAMSDD